MRNRTLIDILAAVFLMAAAHSAYSAGNQERTQQQIAVLQSNAPFFDKARACQQLGEFGTREAVPVLAALLGDPHLNAYARSGLEGIPDPAAAEALRKAAGALKGDLLIGVINSLGVLRDEKAVSLLRAHATNPNGEMTGAALLALGRIANTEAIKILETALKRGSELQRTNAAAACLMAAEKQWADGHADNATTLYDAVRNADVPAIYRAGATRGAIVARKNKAARFLVEQLGSKERIIRNAALLAIREIRSEALAKALNEELTRSSGELQVQLLLAMPDCHDDRTLPIIHSKVASADPEVRRTALKVLGRMGGATEAELLLRTLVENKDEEESRIALTELERMEGRGIDELCVKALASASDAGSRIKLIRLIESRKVSGASDVLTKLAADADSKVRIAALRALKSLAGPSDAAALIALIKACRDDATRDTAENTLIGIYAKAGETTPATDSILSELKQTSDPVLKKSWANVLISLGNARALPALYAAARGSDESVASYVVEQLVRWPDPTPVEELLALVQAGPGSAIGKRALTTSIQLATAAVEERQRPDAVLIQWFQRAAQAAQTLKDRRLIVSALGRVKQVQSHRLLAAYLDGGDLQNEAALAILQIAPALRQTDAPALKASLDKIAATSPNPDLRAQASKAAAALPLQTVRQALFDGKTLSGWEGNAKVWQVRDGVIVGGSLSGNPQNEFLATEKKYSNFVLRLEYKLVGSEGFVNGGVQFRSVRVKQPANEMSGYQADIGAGYSGCLYDESRRNKFLVRPSEDKIKQLEKAGDWNRYEVHCAGPRIQIVLNGETTVDYTEKEAGMAQEGLIGLQIHGGCKAEISFRNVTVETPAE